MIKGTITTINNSIGATVNILNPNIQINNLDISTDTKYNVVFEFQPDIILAVKRVIQSETNAKISEDNANTYMLASSQHASDALSQANLATSKATIATQQATISTQQAVISTTQAGISTTQAGIAEQQAIIATTQAGISTEQAGISTSQAEIATEQAGLASISASNALISEGKAKISEDNAKQSETNAHTSEENALSSANTASDYTETATEQAGIALEQATISTTQAGISTTQAGLAQGYASDASGYAANAQISATNAYNSEVAALGYKNDCEDLVGDLSNHIIDTSNPHSVTASQVGLGNVTNESKVTMFTNPTFTGSVTINESISSPDYIQFDTAASVTSAEGKLYWDMADGRKTLSLGMTGGNVVQQIGEEIYYRIKASSAITNGQVVMVTGTVGNSGVLTGAPATNLNIHDGLKIIGIATEDIALHGWGYITWFGVINGIDTTGTPYGEVWQDNDDVYFNPSIPGGLTKNIPDAPNVRVRLARVIHTHSSGSLFVRPVSGSVFGGTDSNVQFSTLANKDFVVYNTTTNRWENQQVTASDIGALQLSGGTMTGSLTLNADPITNMQASTKQYVDGKTNHMNPIIAAIIFGG